MSNSTSTTTIGAASDAITDTELIAQSMNKTYFFLNNSFEKFPGYGPREWISPSDRQSDAYASLDRNFRYIIGILATTSTPFLVPSLNLLFVSEQHALAASMFPHMAQEFSVSGDNFTPMSTDSFVARDWTRDNIGTISEQFEINLHSIHLEISLARYAVDPVARKVLTGTRDALLTCMHPIHKEEHVFDKVHIYVRDSLQSNSKK